MTWTTENDEKLKELWPQSMSTARMGEILGTTKNAVIGRAHRLGLARKKTASPGRPKVNKVGKIVHILSLPPKPPPEGTEGIPLMELAYHHCRAIIGASNDPRGLATYCGQRKFGGTSWCEYHLGLYTYPYRGKNVGSRTNYTAGQRNPRKVIPSA